MHEMSYQVLILKFDVFQGWIVTVKPGGTGAYRSRPRLEWPQDEEALNWEERAEKGRFMWRFKCGNQKQLMNDFNAGRNIMWIDPINGQVFNEQHMLVGKCTHRNPDRTYRANSFQAYGPPPSKD